MSAASFTGSRCPRRSLSGSLATGRARIVELAAFCTIQVEAALVDIGSAETYSLRRASFGSAVDAAAWPGPRETLVASSLVSGVTTSR